MAITELEELYGAGLPWVGGWLRFRRHETAASDDGMERMGGGNRLDDGGDDGRGGDSRGGAGWCP